MTVKLHRSSVTWFKSEALHPAGASSVTAAEESVI